MEFKFAGQAQPRPVTPTPRTILDTSYRCSTSHPSLIAYHRHRGTCSHLSSIFGPPRMSVRSSGCPQPTAGTFQAVYLYPKPLRLDSACHGHRAFGVPCMCEVHVVYTFSEGRLHPAGILKVRSSSSCHPAWPLLLHFPN